MVARYVKRRGEDKATQQMDPDELLGLLSDAEREAVRKRRAGTTLQPLQSSLAPIAPVDDLAIPMAAAEHSPLPVPKPQAVLVETAPIKKPEALIVQDATTPIADEAQFAIDTRELDARVFRKHALDLSRRSGSRAAVVPIAPATPAPVVAAAPDGEATDLVAPLDLDALAPRSRARIFAWTTVISVALTGGVLLALQFLK